LEPFSPRTKRLLDNIDTPILKVYLYPLKAGKVTIVVIDDAVYNDNKEYLDLNNLDHLDA
jgi:hypothetical protein